MNPLTGLYVRGYETSWFLVMDTDDQESYKGSIAAFHPKVELFRAAKLQDEELAQALLQ